MLRKQTICIAGIVSDSMASIVTVKSGGVHAGVSVSCKANIRRPRVQRGAWNCRCDGQQRAGRCRRVLHVCRLSSRLRSEGRRRAQASSGRASRGPRDHGRRSQPQRRRQSRWGSPLEPYCGSWAECFWEMSALRKSGHLPSCRIMVGARAATLLQSSLSCNCARRRSTTSLISCSTNIARAAMRCLCS